MWFWLIVIIIVPIAACTACSNGDSDEAANTNSEKPSTTTETPKKEEDTKVTYENFLKIKMGASLADVESILGKGTEESSSDDSGIKTVMYSWNGPGISNMEVTIQNNAVTDKAQSGLAPNNAKVSLDKYNQVKEGMTYDQVKGILGEGQVTSQANIMDAESITYSWINNNGSNMDCIFLGGKMSTKAQAGLK